MMSQKLSITNTLPTASMEPNTPSSPPPLTQLAPQAADARLQREQQPGGAVAQRCTQEARVAQVAGVGLMSHQGVVGEGARHVPGWV